MLHQLNFGLLNRLCFGKPKPVAHSEHMGIHGDRRHTESIGQDYVCSLPTNSRKRFKRISVGRHFAAVFLCKFFACCNNILRFSIEESAGFDVNGQLIRRHFRHDCRIGVITEQCRGAFIDLLVRALRGENGRNQKLKRIGKVQFRLCVRIGFGKNPQYLSVPFFSAHFFIIHLSLFRFICQRLPPPIIFMSWLISIPPLDIFCMLISI